MRGKYKLVGMVAVILTVIAAGGLMLHLMNAPAPAVAEDSAVGVTGTIVDETGQTVEDTRTDEDLEAAYLAGVPAYDGDKRYIDYVIDRTIEDAPGHITMYGKTFGVLENGETFGIAAEYVDEDGQMRTYAPDYEPAIGTFFASDGALVWVRWDDELNASDLNTPGEVKYAAAHPREVQYPLYAKPGGEVYEYKTETVGGLGIFGGGDSCTYLIVTLVDSTEIELLMEDYKANPSILDQYDVKYLVASDYPADQQVKRMPGQEEGFDTVNGTHLLVKLRDNSVVDIPIDDYYANPDILDQYDIRDIIRTEKSLAEYEAMGVAYRLFW